ncbi:MAG: hypothetical protein U0457_11700 [Candidatus Sericytochromatia bacterium]
MKKILISTLFSSLLFSCSNQTAQNISIAPEENTAISSASSNWGNLIGENFSLKKDATLKQLTKNTITVEEDTINRDKNTLIVRFSKGDLTPNSHFKIIMFLRKENTQYYKKGDAGLSVENSYFGGCSLTKDEAYKLLKSAENYSKYSAQIDKIFK